MKESNPISFELVLSNVLKDSYLGNFLIEHDIKVFLIKTLKLFLILIFYKNIFTINHEDLIFKN